MFTYFIVGGAIYLCIWVYFHVSDGLFLRYFHVYRNCTLGIVATFSG